MKNVNITEGFFMQEFHMHIVHLLHELAWPLKLRFQEINYYVICLTDNNICTKN